MWGKRFEPSSVSEQSSADIKAGVTRLHEALERLDGAVCRSPPRTSISRFICARSSSRSGRGDARFGRGG